MIKGLKFVVASSWHHPYTFEFSVKIMVEYPAVFHLKNQLNDFSRNGLRIWPLH